MCGHNTARIGGSVVLARTAVRFPTIHVAASGVGAAIHLTVVVRLDACTTAPLLSPLPPVDPPAASV